MVSTYLIHTVYAERSQNAIVKDIILKKRELENSSSKWELYVKALDAYFEKYQDDTEKISNIVSKVSQAKSKLWNSKKEKEIRLLIEYIEYKSELLLIWTTNTIETITKDIDFLNMNGDDAYSYAKILNLDEEQLYKFLSWLSEQEIEIFAKNIFTSQEIQDWWEEYLESLQKYSNDAKDSKIHSDTRSFASWIETELIIWNTNYDYLLWEIISNKSQWDTNWYIGYPNYENLLYGWRESWLDSYWYEYIIAYYNNGENIYYQVLWFLWNNPKNLTAKIRWNYIDWSLISNYEEGKIYDLSWERDYTDSQIIELSEKELYISVLYYEWYLVNNPDIITWYEIDPKNSKVSSNLRTLIAIFETYITTGDMEFEDIVLHEWKKSYSSSVWDIHYGVPNYLGLKLDVEDFRSPWESYPYQAAYLIDSNWNNFYQFNIDIFQ